MTTTTLLHYNVLYKNDRATVRGDLEALTKRTPGISYADLNEARETSDQGKAIKDFCRAHGWEHTWTPGDVCAIWDPKVWTFDGFRGTPTLTRGAQELGLPFSHNPRRHLLYQGMTHKDGTRHLFYGLHHTAGYTKADGEFGPTLMAYKRQAGRECVLGTNRIQARHFATKPEYEFHHTLGDMNAPQGRVSQWWFPSVVMDGLWVPDTRRGAIDWIMHSRAAAANGLKVQKRWIERAGLDSDHAAHLATITWPRP